MERKTAVCPEDLQLLNPCSMKKIELDLNLMPKNFHAEAKKLIEEADKSRQRHMHNIRKVWEQAPGSWVWTVTRYRCIDQCGAEWSVLRTGRTDRCTVCDGQMKYDSYLGGEDREHQHKCADCGRTEEST
ncbi:MAG: hypothetical protein A2542_00175 [Parcubacteria group bacterium RIFOXYD2_FULL_52_8]|nr:MAG: hypothetical protein A2542_00175 [Parcubacteria group bacterium RIFOXYD2_FULL_52_8]